MRATPTLVSKAPPLRQRLTARALVASKRAADGRSTLDRLEQDGSAKVRLPRSADAALTAVTLNTAGGLTGGDRIAWQAVAGEGSRLTVASAACEKIYRTHGPPAEQSTRLAVAAGARLDWLPQETIVFDGARLHRTLDATLGPGGRLLVAEALVLGRRASGETLSSVEIRDTWRVHDDDGRLLHAEALRLGDDWPRELSARGALGGLGAIATVLYCADEPDERLDARATALHDLIDAGRSEATGGASALAGRVVVRLAARSGFALRRILLPCLELLQDGDRVPAVWHV